MVGPFVLAALLAGCVFGTPNDRLMLIASNRSSHPSRIIFNVSFATTDATIGLADGLVRLEAGHSKTIDAGRRPCDLTNEAGGLQVELQVPRQELAGTWADHWSANACGPQRILAAVGDGTLDVDFAFAD